MTEEKVLAALEDWDTENPRQWCSLADLSLKTNIRSLLRLDDICSTLVAKNLLWRDDRRNKVWSNFDQLYYKFHPCIVSIDHAYTFEHTDDGVGFCKNCLEPVAP